MAAASGERGIANLRVRTRPNVVFKASVRTPYPARAAFNVREIICARHQRKQILQPIRACAEDDDRNTRCGDILLITKIAIHRDEDLEACVSHQAQEVTVALTRPTLPRHGGNSKPGELTTEPVGHALVEQDALP